MKQMKEKQLHKYTRIARKSINEIGTGIEYLGLTSDMYFANVDYANEECDGDDLIALDILACTREILQLAQEVVKDVLDRVDRHGDFEQPEYCIRDCDGRQVRLDRDEFLNCIRKYAYRLPIQIPRDNIETKMYNPETDTFVEPNDEVDYSKTDLH